MRRTYTLMFLRSLYWLMPNGLMYSSSSILPGWTGASFSEVSVVMRLLLRKVSYLDAVDGPLNPSEA